MAGLEYVRKVDGPPRGPTIGLKSPPVDVTWPQVLGLWREIDQTRDFDSAWVFDHFDPRFDRTTGAMEAFTLLAALAAQTSRISLGALVLGATHRHPALVAKMSANLDQISGGRFILAIGAGWHEAEHRMYGWPLPAVGRRIAFLEESVIALKGMLAHPSGFTLRTSSLQLTNATCLPPPLTHGGPPVWVAAGGARGIGIAACLADVWVSISPPGPESLEEFRSRRRLLEQHLERCERDSGPGMAVQVPLGQHKTGEVFEHCLGLIDENVGHLIFAPDAFPTGKEIARLISEVVRPLRGHFGRQR